ncbi:uncharacterized protein [Scyliorhinus torazame]|uniref:uncharacterized protein isoform X2 n=1 Tax=Scyliorhinus torazame TaxID=75743 RepID=UPI003B5AC3BB
MSEAKAPRFSDEAVETLVQQVRSRQEVFYPSDGRRMPRQTLRQAWEEVALSVNARTEIIRTGLQCRKKFNDLTRTARNKRPSKQVTCSSISTWDLGVAKLSALFPTQETDFQRQTHSQTKKEELHSRPHPDGTGGAGDHVDRQQEKYADRHR